MPQFYSSVEHLVSKNPAWTSFHVSCRGAAPHTNTAQLNAVADGIPQNWCTYQAVDDEYGRNSTKDYIADDGDKRGEQKNPVQPKTSALRSVLARGGNSPSAAALAFKDRLGRRISKFSFQDSKETSSSGGGLRAARGRGLGRDKPGFRPPVQHSDSISSDEGRDENPRGRDTTSGDEASSNGDEASPAPGDDRETGDDDNDDRSEGGGHPYDPRMRHHAARGIESGGGGAVTSTPSVDYTKHRRHQLTGHLRQLNSSARSLRWSNTNITSSETTATNRKTATTGKRRLPQKGKGEASVSLAPPSYNARSSSSTTTSREERDRPGAIITNTSSSSPTGVGTGASLRGDESTPIHTSNNNKRGQRKRSIFRGLAIRRQNEDQRVLGKMERPAPTGPGGLSPTSSSHRGTPRLEHQSMLPWRRVGGWDKLDDAAGDHEGTVVSGMGRPAVGTVENVLYGWFGGLVARPWSGVGLALLPDCDVKVRGALGVGVRGCEMSCLLYTSDAADE